MLTCEEIAAVLGISSSAVRHIVRRNGIRARGKRGRAKVYLSSEVIRHAGGHDRRPSGHHAHGVSQ